MPKLLDLTGNTFGRLSVMAQAPTVNNRTAWHCKCSCGTEKIIATGALRSGAVVSCGCYHKEQIGKINYRHGYSQTKLYKAYTAMIQRCHNPDNPSYPDYGRRGIHVCEEWRADRVKFLEWSISNGYEPGLSIDRRDNDLGYSPGNCRWVDMGTQALNKRSNRLIEINGETRTLAEWLRVSGISRRTFYDRVAAGWDEITALTKPARIVRSPVSLAA